MGALKTIEKQIPKLANLAKLDLTVGSLSRDPEMSQASAKTIFNSEQFSKDLNRILSFIEQISQVNTHNIAPMSHPLPDHFISKTLREDIISEPNQKNKLQELSNYTESGLYLVPQVINEN